MDIHQINPIKASENIRQTYIRYLITTFGLKNLEMAKQFKNLAYKSEGLFKGPILEATPKYKKGKSILDLATEKGSFLSEGFLNFVPGMNRETIENHLPLERELYLHQEKALRKVAGENRNIVISTGTGSGKTECFLLPIIDYLIKEREANKLGHGVRALLMYPMNALANDQIKRLRTLLPPETGITFGRYTGQTKQSYYDGIDAYKQENNGKFPQANELFCRDQILGVQPSKKDWPHQDISPVVGPPHILLTNFAMLEYLLMRPKDSAIFDAGAGDTWRFIVLDEAHIYSGALGTEISYLIRRLKDRVCNSQQGKLLCIATSATIGADNQETKETIAASFQNLFGEPFDHKDVLTGDLVPPEDFLDHSLPWGRGEPNFYTATHDLIQAEYPSSDSFCDDIEKKFLDKDGTKGWPDKKTVLKTIENIRKQKQLPDSKAVFLYFILAGDVRLRKLIQTLEKNPVDLKKATKLIWETQGRSLDVSIYEKCLVLLVTLGSKARLSITSAPLLSCRYHFFVRSLEGLSICLAKEKQNISSPKLLLGRHSKIMVASGEEASCFELRACGRCGQPYLHGYLLDDGRFVSYVQRSKLEEKLKNSTHFVIDLDKVVDPAEDEDPLMDAKPPVSNDDEENDPIVFIGSTQLSDIQYLCSKCGFISDTNSSSCQYCRRHKKTVNNEWIAVRRVSPANGAIIKVCPACGGRKNFGASIIRPFSPGDDAAGAVLGQALMSEIPKTSESSNDIVDDVVKKKGRFAKSVQPKSKITVNGKQRLLAFSDSRQDAAYFATYLDRTSNQILHRQLILRAARQLLKQNDNIQVFDVNDLIRPLIDEAQRIGLFGVKETPISKISEVSKWINAELIGIQRRYGLEGVGLIQWELKCRNELLKIALYEENGIQKDYQLSAEEFISLLEVFLTELRRQNVLQQLTNVSIQDTYFWPRNRPYTIRSNHVHAALSIASWHPQANRNMRSDFIERFFKKTNRALNKEKIKNLLEDLWGLSFAIEDDGIWEEIPSVNALWGGRGNDGAVWQIRNDAWVGKLTGGNLYKCDLCGNYSSINLGGVCPTYKCLGELSRVDQNIEFNDNHYRYLYEELPVPISVKEHTAQLTNQEGAERQQKFTDDKDPINVLSCSTTFELGVDVGELHSVFMRNVPPTIANYVQRSGRAGRRLSAAAYVLTYCRRRPHDLGYFDVANKLISGKIIPSKTTIQNKRIAKRHLNAVVLSHYWRKQQPELFNGPTNKRRGIVNWLFFDPKTPAAQALYDWLLKKDIDLYDELIRIFATKKINGLDIGIQNWDWIVDLVEKEIGTDGKILWGGQLGLAQSELCTEYSEYEKIQKEKPALHSYAEMQKKRILERQSLDFLASRNVLPKYGFPVDVVSLKLQSKDSWAQRVELDRDLKLALSEYAPGCTLVANGRVVKSYALEKIAGRAWPEYRFKICSECGKFHRTEISHGEIEEKCECGNSLTGKDSTILEGIFVEPVYGFKTQLNEDGVKPVEVRPQKTYSTRVYFSHYKPVTVKDPFIPEGDSNALIGITVKKRYSRYGVLAVLNPGRSNRGFWLCPYCGFGDSVANAKPKKHKTAWGQPCNGKLKFVFLGHEFQSDVLELRFEGISSEYNQGFWLSLTAALLAGAAKALDIQRSDIDGTVLRYGGSGYRSFVLYDTVPGGAGHVKRIENNLQRVMEQAFNIAENCPGCSRDQSCNSCLRNFNNQYAHDLLSRGQVAEFLSVLISGLYNKNNNGYFSLGLTDSQRWFEQQMRRSSRVDLFLNKLPKENDSLSGINFYHIINKIAQKGVQIRLFFADQLNTPENLDYASKITLHSLAILCQMKNVDIFLNCKKSDMPANLFFKVGDDDYAVKWEEGKNPFSEDPVIEISKLKEFTDKVENQFNVKAIENKKQSVEYSYFLNLLQNTNILHIDSGEKSSWSELLEAYLPQKIHTVEIYDRFVRNQFQFKSLSMFIDMIKKKSGENSVKIQVNTTSDETQFANSKFKELQKEYENSSITLHYKVVSSDFQMPHYRKIQIDGDNSSISIWLDRGLDIYRFSNLNPPQYETLETYIVIEN